MNPCKKRPLLPRGRVTKGLMRVSNGIRAEVVILSQIAHRLLILTLKLGGGSAALFEPVEAHWIASMGGFKSLEVCSSCNGSYGRKASPTY